MTGGLSTSPAVFLSLVQFWHIRESGLRSQRDCYLSRAKFWQRNCGAVRRMGRRRGFAANTHTRKTNPAS